jgi:hypothetical protein
MTTPADVRRYLTNWQGEVDSAAQYRAMGLAAAAATYGIGRLIGVAVTG